MTADLLRRAAARAQELAEAATPGPWGFGGSGVATFYVDRLPSGAWSYKEDAPHRVIAKTHEVSEQATREASAAWLAETRRDAANGELIAACGPPFLRAVGEWLAAYAGQCGFLRTEPNAFALAVARALLGES